MHYHHYTIMFVIIFMVFAMRMQVVVLRYEQTADNYTQIERSFFAAADMAGEVLCRYGASGIITDKSAALESFLSSMYTSLGILDNPAERERFLNYIPMFAALANDGFYIYFEDEYEKEDGYHYVTRNWSECMPYSYSDKDFVYRFTLDGLVTIFDKNGIIDGTVRLYQATQEELTGEPEYAMLRSLRPNSFLFEPVSFNKVKLTAVITKIQDAMRYHVNNHNRIAKEIGIAYDFALPVIDNSIWARSIEHPGVLVMIQGYPVDAAGGMYYNQYAFVGAQIYKSEPYYITPWGWHPTYHRRSCDTLDCAGSSILLHPFYSVEECVKQGAYACEKCVPGGALPPNIIYPPWSEEKDFRPMY